jgi:hypothetical protein
MKEILNPNWKLFRNWEFGFLVFFVPQMKAASLRSDKGDYPKKAPAFFSRHDIVAAAL